MAKEYYIEVSGKSSEQYQELKVNLNAEDNSSVMGHIKPIIEENLELFDDAVEIKIKITLKSDPVAFKEGLKKYLKPSKEDEVAELSAACDLLSHNADVIASGKCSNCNQVNIL